MKKLFTLLIIISALNIGNSQKFESVQLIQSYTISEINQIIGISVNYPVTLYKMRYFTTDLDGNESIASGLLCVPQSETLIFPLACYQHGTVGSREEVPSNLQGGFQLPLIFASYGYVVCAPDYLGLGDSPGVHPFVHSATQASAAIDMMRATREYDLETEEYDLSEQVFVTGYSQGGHAAMAAHQVLEEQFSDEFVVTAAAPMSGPYSISGKTASSTLGDQEYETVAYIVNVVRGYKAAYPQLLADYEFEDVFKPEYLNDIYQFDNEEISLWELNDRLSDTLIAKVGKVTPKDLLMPGILELFQDETSPFFQAMKDNDNYDWTPQAPTRIYYCRFDEQIIYTNATLADSVMNANGAADVEAVRMDDFTPLTHGGCVIPASFAGIFFFRDYQNLLTSTEDLIDDPNVTINYNNEIVMVNIPKLGYANNNNILITDLTGRTVFSDRIESGLTWHETGWLSKGMYVVSLYHNNKLIKTERIVRM